MKGKNKMSNKQLSSYLTLLKAYIENATDKESVLKVIEEMQKELK